jgi:hypothetical protein
VGGIISENILMNCVSRCAAIRGSSWVFAAVATRVVTPLLTPCQAGWRLPSRLEAFLAINVKSPKASSQAVAAFDPLPDPPLLVVMTSVCCARFDGNSSQDKGAEGQGHRPGGSPVSGIEHQWITGYEQMSRT